MNDVPLFTRTCNEKLTNAKAMIFEMGARIAKLENELAQLKEKHKPKEWCCALAKASRGWEHNPSCAEYVVKF